MFARKFFVTALGAGAAAEQQAHASGSAVVGGEVERRETIVRVCGHEVWLRIEQFTDEVDGVDLSGLEDVEGRAGGNQRREDRGFVHVAGELENRERVAVFRAGERRIRRDEHRYAPGISRLLRPRKAASTDIRGASL